MEELSNKTEAKVIKIEEKNPQEPAIIEKGIEATLSEVEILSAMSVYAEGGKRVRALEEGGEIYLLELLVEGPVEGETAEYTYRRKGNFGNNKYRSPDTLIEVVHYKDGDFDTGDTLANFDPNTKEWKPTEAAKITTMMKKVRRSMGGKAFDELLDTGKKGREEVETRYKSLLEEEARQKVQDKFDGK